MSKTTNHSCVGNRVGSLPLGKGSDVTGEGNIPRTEVPPSGSRVLIVPKHLFLHSILGVSVVETVRRWVGVSRV